MTGLRALIVDLDGTFALNESGRPWYGPGFEERVREDDVNEVVEEVIDALLAAGVVQTVLFVTGRMEVARTNTELWLNEGPGYVVGDAIFELFMRKDRDFRADEIVKREIYDEHIRRVYDVRLALDDKPSLIDLWRSLGIPAWQVNEYR